MADPAGIVPFRQFVDSLNSAQLQQHVGAAPGGPSNIAAVAEMRDYLVRYYEGVEAEISFMDDGDSVFDCIPVEQQPALRATGGRPATPVDSPAAAADAAPGGAAAPSSGPLPVRQTGPDLRDRNGNQKLAPAGTIPMRRLTLENLARFGSLRQFFQKSPHDSSPPPQSADPQGGPAPGGGNGSRRWAHAFQNVDNLGGSSMNNYWNPPVITPFQTFSLSQQWCSGGSGNAHQTAEVGWQVFPQFYGHLNPVLFIYWTADDYRTTGCYNLTCPAFVQTSGSVTLGGTLWPWSTPGGPQYALYMSFYLIDGKWWLYINGSGAHNAVGYYPASIYRGGAMSTKASVIDFGGEVLGAGTWPPMGSGAFASAGWQYAAYQNDISYFPTTGGKVAANLTPVAASPQCYTVTVMMLTAPWNETIYLGGPGGTNC